MVFAAAVLGLMMSAAGASAASADMGYQGSHVPRSAGGSPTGSKPESKLWYAGGAGGPPWPSSLSGDHHIFGLDQTTHSWADTGVAADTRGPVRDDALWDAATGKLYIASHTYFSGEKRGGEETTPANVGRIWRYSFDAASGTWSPDAGSRGRSTPRRPRRWSSTATRPACCGRPGCRWTRSPASTASTSTTRPTRASPGRTPAPVPGSPAATGDDVSSVIPFGGNRIGVMYSSEAPAR